MAVIDFKAGFDAYVAAHQKVWRHDRSKSVGASEAFGCLRKAWFNKHGTPKDANHSESWGAMKRGDIIEEHHVEPAIRWYLEEHFPKARLIWGGRKQRTLIGKDAPLSATPDGLVINADDDALAPYGIPSLDGAGCFNFEIKSIDPRVNLREEKSIHRGQVQVQMGLTRELTPYKPNYAVICYVDASFLDDIDVFIVPFDQRAFDASKDRARSAFDVLNVAEIMPEGKIDGTCEYCPYKSACAKASGDATPTDGEANEKSAPLAIMQEFEALVTAERALAAAKKVSEAEHKEASEKLKQWFREVGVKRAQAGDIKATISWTKGRKSLDQEAMKSDGIDLRMYEKEGEGYDTLRITEKGPQKAEAD